MSPYIVPGLRAKSIALVKHTPIKRIKIVVSEYYDVSIKDMESRSRKRPFVVARHAVMYLAKKYGGLTLTDIGRAFNRDHTTVIHSMQTVEDLMQTDDFYRAQIIALSDIIKQGYTVGVFVEK